MRMLFPLSYGVVGGDVNPSGFKISHRRKIDYPGRITRRLDANVCFDDPNCDTLILRICNARDGFWYREGSVVCGTLIIQERIWHRKESPDHVVWQFLIFVHLPWTNS